MRTKSLSQGNFMDARIIIGDNEIIINANRILNIEIIKNDLLKRGFLLGFPRFIKDKKRKLIIANYHLMGIVNPICLS